jgi:hypothetical protein
MLLAERFGLLPQYRCGSMKSLRILFDLKSITYMIGCNCIAPRLSESYDRAAQALADVFSSAAIMDCYKLPLCAMTTIAISAVSYNLRLTVVDDLFNLRCHTASSFAL